MFFIFERADMMKTAGGQEDNRHSAEPNDYATNRQEASRIFVTLMGRATFTFVILLPEQQV